MNSIKEEVTLLPCPFCGGEARIIEPAAIDLERYVSCQKCGISMDAFDHGDPDFITAWNTRSTSDLRAKAEGLAGALAYAEPYVETLHSLLLQNAGPKSEAVRLCWKALKKARTALDEWDQSQ